MSDDAIVRGYVTAYSRSDGRGCLNTQASPSQPCRQIVEARNGRLHLTTYRHSHAAKAEDRVWSSQPSAHRRHRPPCTRRPTRATVHYHFSMTDSGCQDNSIHEMDNTTTGAASTSCLALATPRLSKWWALGRQFFSAVSISINSGQRVR